MIRTTKSSILLELAQHATVPVISGLTDVTHPCQLMADVMTFEEHLGPIEGKEVAWSGDGNNMATSWIHAAVRFKSELRPACPEPLRPPQAVLDWAPTEGARIVVSRDAASVDTDADGVVTDTVVSTGADEDGALPHPTAPY